VPRVGGHVEVLDAVVAPVQTSASAHGRGDPPSNPKGSHFVDVFRQDLFLVYLYVWQLLHLNSARFLF
jgi:hypothetical protein